MTPEEITQAIAQKAGEDAGLNAKVLFLLDGEHQILLDSTSVPNTTELLAAGTEAEAKCTIKAKSSTISKILGGDTNAMMAFMMGKIKVDGDIGVAMAIAKIL